MFYRAMLCLGLCAGLSACSDGRGSIYSSARAQQAAPSYIPITPGATPVTETAPAQGAVVVQNGVLTEPVAITPGATPVEVAALDAPGTFDATTAQAPAVSLKPQTAERGQARIVQASAPASTRVATTQQRPSTKGPRYAKGTIYNACRQAGRKEASDRRCGCVQWVADQRLNPDQQRRGAGYFSNQQGLQDTRQSDRATDERFWTAWKAFGQDAGRQCRST